MSFGPVFQHRAHVGEPSSFGSIFQHRVAAGAPSSFGSLFQHRFTGGSPSSFGPVFQHEAEVGPLGRIRGDQLESPLPIQRAIDIAEGSETSAPAGFVRLYARDGTLRFTNSTGLNVDLGALGVPLGGIISWWPSQGADLPDGFEYCDGTTVSTANSPLFGIPKPGLMRSPDAPSAVQRFIRGADASGGNYGGSVSTFPVVGGTSSHTHSFQTDLDGEHEHDAGSHTHVISNEPDHNHGGVNGSPDGFTGGAIISAAFGGQRFVEDVTSGDKEHHIHQIGLDGAHDHGGATFGPASGQVDMAGEHDHTGITFSSANDPLYVELAWIIRVL